MHHEDMTLTEALQPVITSSQLLLGRDDVTGASDAVVQTRLQISGPYSLREVALMGFGHRDEHDFDGVMRLAFCVDGDYERQVGVEVRQAGAWLDLQIHRRPGADPFDEPALDTIRRQVARVLSVDHDGEAFEALCATDPVLAQLHAVAPGFRPALFYSPYEAAVWSIISARRIRAQGIALRTRIGQQFGATVHLAGVPTVAVPTPSQLLGIDAIPGLPTDRIPRLHAVATAALDPEDAMRDLQQLPGIGPFYSALILIRACGAADVLPVEESKSREVVRELYGWERNLTNSEYAAFAERWRPFRTWATVMMRALSPRLSRR
jgi:DNA-3-methyladenine glycosylase II